MFGADNLTRPLEMLAKEGVAAPTPDELRLYAHDGLRPLVARIEHCLAELITSSGEQDESGNFALTIKTKYQKQLRQHCRMLRKHADVLSQPKRISRSERFGSWLAKLVRPFRQIQTRPKQHLASVALAVTFQRLLDNQISALGYESDLVLDALRRSTNHLNNASFKELSAYVSGLSPEQLAGVVSNTKGIYHELLFVEMYNASCAAESAQVMEETNFPGADVQFFLDGDVVREVQLKAINSPTLVYEHLERYPDIEILVTEETAAILDGIGSSGLSNAILSQDVANRLQDLQSDGLLDDINDRILTSAFVTSAFVVWNVLKTRGPRSIDFKQYLGNAGIAVGAATAVEGAIALASG